MNYNDFTGAYVWNKEYRDEELDIFITIYFFYAAVSWLGLPLLNCLVDVIRTWTWKTSLRLQHAVLTSNCAANARCDRSVNHHLSRIRQILMHLIVLSTQIVNDASNICLPHYHHSISSEAQQANYILQKSGAESFQGTGVFEESLV